MKTLSKIHIIILKIKFFEILSTTSENNTKENPLKIRLFEGITIEGIYNKPKEKKIKLF